MRTDLGGWVDVDDMRRRVRRWATARDNAPREVMLLRTRARLGVASVLVALVGLAATGSAGADARAGSLKGTPAPGSPAEVARLVAASDRISTLPKGAIPQLFEGYADNPYRLYPRSQACSGYLRGCAFGDVHSKKVVVLFGDSHVLMWLPAIDPAAKRARIKLLLIYKNSCPVAIIGNFSLYPGSYGSLAGCEAFRNQAISVIHTLNPFGVIIGERTTLVYEEPAHTLYSAFEWQVALEATIQRLKTQTMKIAVLQDTNWFDLNPMTCLGAYPTQIQKCQQSYPNATNPGHAKAEWRAARATGAHYIFTRSWLCAKECSAVVGHYVTYSDNGHVSATYAAFLSVVMGNALAPVFK
jgi:SGNH domain (fused to AT3 domains)